VMLFAALTIGATPSTQPSGTRTANCDVNVWTDYDLQANLPAFRNALIDYLDNPARMILKVSPEVLQEYLNVKIVSQPGADPVKVHLFLNLDSDARPAAREFLNQVIAVMPAAIEGMENPGLEQTQDVEFRLEDRQQGLQQESNGLRTAISNMNLIDSSPDAVREMADKLQTEREEVRLEAAATKAERVALMEQIVELTTGAEAKAADDAIAKELENIVKIKEKRAEFVKNQLSTGLATPEQLDNAQAEAAEARVQLLERREAVAQAGGDMLADLRKQLVNLNVSFAEINARDQAIEESAKRLTHNATDIASRAQDITAELKRLQQQIDACSEQYMTLRDQAQTKPKPLVRVVPEVTTQRGQ